MEAFLLFFHALTRAPKYPTPSARTYKTVVLLVSLPNHAQPLAIVLAQSRAKNVFPTPASLCRTVNPSSIMKSSINQFGGFSFVTSSPCIALRGSKFSCFLCFFNKSFSFSICINVCLHNAYIHITYFVVLVHPILD